MITIIMTINMTTMMMMIWSLINFLAQQGWWWLHWWLAILQHSSHYHLTPLPPPLLPHHHHWLNSQLLHSYHSHQHQHHIPDHRIVKIVLEIKKAKMTILAIVAIVMNFSLNHFYGICRIMFFVLIFDDDDGGSGRGTNFPVLMDPEAVLLFCVPLATRLTGCLGLMGHGKLIH